MGKRTEEQKARRQELDRQHRQDPEWARREREKLNTYWRTHPEKRREKQQRYAANHPDYYPTRNKRQVREMRTEAFTHYGNACQCCGESTYEFLCIDHVNGGGNKERKLVNRAGYGFLLHLKQQGWPDGYQTLCHNCNLAKGFYGACPHQTERR